MASSSVTDSFTEPFSEHGVFVVVQNIGLMIRGPAGIGKSTLALELIERGHQFVSDDVIEFSYDRKSTQFLAQSPKMLHGLLAVRDLGILNVTQLFQSDRLLAKHPMHLIIELTEGNLIAAKNPLLPYSKQKFHGQNIPWQYIYAHPKRNLAVIVETAVKIYILDKSGNNAGQLLAKRQQQYL